MDLRKITGSSSGSISDLSAGTARMVLETSLKLRGTTDFNATMQEVIAGIREHCVADHCCIIVIDEAKRNCSVLAEAFAEGSGLMPMAEYLDSGSYEFIESWKKTLGIASCIFARGREDMEHLRKKNPVWHEALVSAGVRNIVLFPLKSHNQFLGYIWALNFDARRAAKIRETLEITTFILGSELGNHLLLDRLRQLSTRDMLTGVMNRNEMNNVVDELSYGLEENTSVGVVFADVNCLKAINDMEGHNAGDLLLKNAASILKSVFSKNEIYRAGGDEFTIIVRNITKEELDEKIERVRQGCKGYDRLSFSIGGCVEKNCRNVRMALRRADEIMYEDKNRFYEQFSAQSDGDRRRLLPPGAETMQLSEKHERENRILREMNYDSLTGLPSMTFFFQLAESGRNDMHAKDILSAVVYLNLGGMRYFNMKYGFAEGDVLIRELAGLLVKHFGAECCSRFGQDHFAAFCEAGSVEQKLKAVFREMKAANGGRTLPIRAGIYPDSMGMVESSLACDRAKYACNVARDDNRSYFTYYDNRMLTRELNRQYIVSNLDRAIDEKWITAFYQPIVRSTNKKVCDEEALARWIDPVKGMLSPADFIPILEEMRLIYKVDLHIVDIICERIRKQRKTHLPVVPISVNLSRTDFECCDIVEEICSRLDAARIPHSLITIEITESVIGENFEFMKERISRFRELGFQVWMDDFGSGYSSLDLLQELDFDLIKFDMRFMRQFESNPRSRILLTELMRMALSLGFETVTEGVETEEQFAFLCEIGCTKMQGYHFCKPVPFEAILERNRQGIQIGFEAPEESDYQRIASSVNLYDLDAVSSDEIDSAGHYFNTIPMALLETDGQAFSILRSNRSYREFVESYTRSEETEKVATTLLNSMKQCEQIGQRVFISESTKNGETVNALLRKVAENPVKAVDAYAVAILSVTPRNENAVTYMSVAGALSADYIDLYYVDLETEEYSEYHSEAGSSDISIEKNGTDFFNAARKDALEYLYVDDQEKFVRDFTKENVTAALEDHGAFTLTYRLMMDGEPRYVSMKAVRMQGDSSSIVIGVNNVDAQMRQQEMIERLREESITFSRISALMGNFIAIYTVDPESGTYMIYSATDEYSRMGSSRVGTDFFGDSVKEALPRLHPDDAECFLAGMDREKILEKVKNGEVFILSYRLKLSSDYEKLSLRVGLVREKDGPQLIVGVSRV
ncbi:MAG: EAL domain-containing protein [Lachnospiraceae bacterium]|nr:EAL domain-containing protein [Lachnospiraceae bacterium]